MSKIDYLIIGGGIAGTTAAETIRTHDQSSSISIFTEEGDHLYSRVLLPHYLRNENVREKVYLRSREDYPEKNIDLITKTRITSVDVATKTVSTSSGEKIEYGKLLLATGGKVNKLPTPGGDLPQVAYLRTLPDADAIKKFIGESKEALVLGGGFIGIEFAQSFVKNNLKTTAVIREKYFWEAVVGENSGKLLSQILTENGITILAGEEVAEFLGNGKLEKVKLKNGSEIPADIAGVGVGIHLDLEYLKGADIVVKNGVVTNEFLETSAPHVWAAGDAAEFYDPIFSRYHTLGNWANASAQGRIVGLNMVGQKQAFETTSMYSINIFGINFSFLGDNLIDEKTQVVERGSVEEKKIARLLLRDNVLVGVSLINLPIERRVFDQLIKEKVKINASREDLANLSFDLNQLLV